MLKPGDYKKTSGAGVILNKDVAMRFAKELESPLDFLTKEIIPHLEAHGMKDIESQKNYLFRMLGRQTTVRMWHDLLRNLAQVERERTRMEGGMTIEDARALANIEDYEQVKQNLGTSYGNLEKEIGLLGTGPMIKIMETLRNVFEAINEFSRINPGTIRAIGIALSGLAGVLIAGGLWALGAAIAPLVGVGGLLFALAAGIGVVAVALGLVPKVDTHGAKELGHGGIGSDYAATAGMKLPDPSVFALIWADMNKNLPELAAAFRTVGNAVNFCLGPLRALAGAIRALASFGFSGGGKPGEIQNIPGAEGMPSPQKQNWIAPQRGDKVIHLTTHVSVDGRKFAEVMTKHQVLAWSGPAQGSRHFDGTRGTEPLDTAMA
jgi:hypothetical protein